MSDARSPEQLRSNQYRNANNLEARIALHALCSVNPQGWTPWLFEQIESLELSPTAAILELGCGAGTLWRDNAERIPPGWRIALSDFSEGMLEDARQALAALDHEFSFRVANAQDIPFPGNHFHAVFANHMLYHVPDRAKALAEIVRVLRPGGVLVASTLTRESMREIQTLVRGCTESDEFAFNRSGETFALDNAARQLAPFFGSIEERRYVDALEITDPAPLLAYLGSTIQEEPFRPSELDAIAEATRQEIAQHGHFRVRKDSGVFLARS